MFPEHLSASLEAVRVKLYGMGEKQNNENIIKSAKAIEETLAWIAQRTTADASDLAPVKSLLNKKLSEMTLKNNTKAIESLSSCLNAIEAADLQLHEVKQQQSTSSPSRVEELEKALDQTLLSLESLKTELENQKSKSQDEVSVWKTRASKVRAALNETKAQLETVTSEKEVVLESREDLLEKISSLESRNAKTLEMIDSQESSQEDSQEILRLEKQLSYAKSKIENQNLEIESINEKLSNAKSKIENQNLELDDLLQHKSKSDEIQEKLENDVKVRSEELLEVESKLMQAQSSLDAKIEEIQIQKSQIDDFEQMNTSQVEVNDELETELKQEVQSKVQEISSLESALTQAQSHVKDKTLEIESKQVQIDKLLALIDSQKEEQQSNEKEAELKSNETIVNLESNLRDAESKIENQNLDIQSKEAQISEFLHNKSKITNALQESQQKIVDLEAALKLSLESEASLQASLAEKSTVEASAKYEELAAEYAKFKSKAHIALRKVESRAERVGPLSQEVLEKQAEIDLLSQQIESQYVQKKDLQSLVDMYKNISEMAQEDVNIADSSLNNGLTNIVIQFVSGYEKQLDVFSTSVCEKIEILNSKINSAQHYRTKIMEQRVTGMESQIKLEDTIEALSNENESLKKEYEKQSLEIKSIVEENQSVKTNSESLRSQIDLVLAENQLLKNTSTSLKSEMESVLQENQSLKSTSVEAEPKLMVVEEKKADPVISEELLEEKSSTKVMTTTTSQSKPERACRQRQCITIKAGSVFELPIPVIAGEELELEFELQEDGSDIEYSLRYFINNELKNVITEPTRIDKRLYKASLVPLDDIDAAYRVCFDNSYSWFYEKVLTYSIFVNKSQ